MESSKRKNPRGIFAGMDEESFTKIKELLGSPEENIPNKKNKKRRKRGRKPKTKDNFLNDLANNTPNANQFK
jgi:hypothetical protein